MRKLGMPLWAAGFLGGMIGDILVYLASGLILGTTLVRAPNPQYSLSGYLLVIYSAYLPTQLPIATGEALITGLALHYAGRQRPEILVSLGILAKKDIRHSLLFVILPVMILLCGVGSAAISKADAPPAGGGDVDLSARNSTPSRFSGMDETVNDAIALKAGRPAREPYLNTESMGDLWNLLLLSAGGICGFILGRNWHLLWGKSKLQ